MKFEREKNSQKFGEKSERKNLRMEFRELRKELREREKKAVDELIKGKTMQTMELLF